LGKRSFPSIIGAAALVFLLMAMTSAFMPFALFLVMVPLILITAREGIKRVPLFVLPAFALAYFLAAPFGMFAVLVGLFYLPAGLAMGHLYRKQQPARTVVTAGVVTLLGVMLLWLLILYASGQNLIGEFRELLRQYYQSAQPLMQGIVPPGSEQAYLDLLIGSLPLILIWCSLFLTFIAHGLSRWLLAVSGMDVPRLRPIREWMLPRSLVVIFIIVLILNMFVKFDNTSVFSMLVINLHPLLMLAFSVQALSFLFYISHVNGWGKALPVLGIIVLVLFPPASYIYSFLGLLDAVFPLRERLRKKN